MRKTTRMADAITKTPTRANSKGEPNERKQGESKRNKSEGASTNYYKAFNSMFKTKETEEADEEYDVFLANSTSDVSAAVRCAVQNGIPPVPRSGGHSYEVCLYLDLINIIIIINLLLGS